MAELFNYDFSKLGEYLESACNFFPTKYRTSKNSFDFRFVTTKEVLLTLKRLNSNKPSGPSDIPSWALKEALKKAIITPIF